MRRLTAVPVAAALLVPGAAAAKLPPVPRNWPHHLIVGLSEHPGEGAAFRRRAPLEARYQYLAGGVNTGAGWTTWNAGASFPSLYVRESRRVRALPVFTYYQLLQSAPAGGDEAKTDLAHLRDPAVMRAYYADWSLLMRRLGAFAHTAVVVHVEPDLWGYLEQAARRDDAGTVPAAVASTGVRALRSLPNTAGGFARALVRLRDRLAPNVRLAYHVSVWGTKEDPTYSNPPLRHMDVLAGRVARFERSLGARWDMLFGEFSDRDYGFKRVIYGDGGVSQWNGADFRRHVRFVAGVVRRTRRRMVLWQIPLGNTRLNDTWNHFKDNRVQWLLGPNSRGHLRAYARAGVVGLLFGGGADGTTSATSDGGYFLSRVRAYRRAGVLRLP